MYFQVKRWERFQTVINRHFSINIFGNGILVWLISILVSGLLLSTFTFYLFDVHKSALFFVCLLTWPKEPGGLPSMGSHRVGHDWSDLAAAAAARNHNDSGKFFFLLFLFKNIWIMKVWPHLQETWKIQNKITYSSTICYNCLSR